MIIFENTDAWGFEHAIRGMRNPLNSWDKSDSRYGCLKSDDCEGNCQICDEVGDIDYVIGPNDMSLCQRLIKAGTEHAKFMRQIVVSVDITAPLYFWKEFDTYKVGTVANSCSTMHTVHKKEFEMKDFSTDHLMCGFTDEDTGEWSEQNLWWETMRKVVEALNIARRHYIDTGDKQYWYAMIQLLPTSYNQKRTVTLNYENLRSMYFQRRNHKLDEWRVGFVDWVKTLPYAKELIIFEPDVEKDAVAETRGVES